MGMTASSVNSGRMGRPFDSPALNIGATKLAKELGVSVGTVCNRMSKGQTAEFIRADIRAKKGLAPVAPVANQQARSYTPGSAYTPAHPLPRTGPTPGRKQVASNGQTNGHIAAPSAPMQVDEREREREQEPTDPFEGRAAAELRKIQAQADLQALKVEQLRGSLIPLAQVNFWFGQAIVKARDILFRMPAELRDRLSTCDDPITCEKMLMDELVRAVAELREMPMPGGGATATPNAGQPDDTDTEGDED